MKNLRRVLLSASVLIAIGVLIGFYGVAQAEEMIGPSHCTGVYVGKNLTADGSVLIGQNGDENSSHWIEVIAHREWESGTVLEVGVGPEAIIPGVRIEIPQPSETYKYITVRYSEFTGFPKPLENGGINEYKVSVVDVWSPSRKELVEMTLEGQKGLNYSDEARVAMERAKTAREAVEIIGEMIDEYGHATYGGNTHLVADPEEGWIIEEFAGGQGLWIAKRFGPDDFIVTRPGYIGEIPLNYKEDPNYMGSENLISFAIEQGWYDPNSGEPFNVSEIYEEDRDQEMSGHQMKAPAVRLGEKMLALNVPNITVQDVMNLFRSRPFVNRGTKYSQVAQLRSDMPADLTVLWIAIGPSEASPFIPYYLGITDIPIEYKEHRYLTKGEAMRFSLPRERQGRETTIYSYRTFDRLFMLVDEHYDKFHSEVVEVLEGFEAGLASGQEDIEEIALQLLSAGKDNLAKQFLTYYCKTEALKGLQLASTLADAIEAKTEILFGIRELPID